MKVLCLNEIKHRFNNVNVYINNSCCVILFIQALGNAKCNGNTLQCITCFQKEMRNSTNLALQVMVMQCITFTSLV